MAWGNPSRLTIEQSDAIARIPNEIHGDWEFDVGLTLTTVPQLVSVWTACTLSTAVGVTEDTGVFTTTDHAGVRLILERSYANSDANPTDEVLATIDLRKNNVSVQSYSAVIPPASNPGGDGTLSITDPFVFEVTDTDEWTIYVSASDNGGNPVNARLTRMRLSIAPVYAT